MSPRSTTFSLLAIASLFSSSIALPLEVPHILPRQAFSIVNVDGSSSPTSTTLPPTVTQTIVGTVTAPASTYIATVNVDRGSATETIYLTVTPTPAPQPSTTALPPPVIPYFHPHLNSTSNSTSTSVQPSIALSTGTSTEPCEETPEPVDDGAPWRHPYNLVPTGTGSGYASPTGSYDGPVAARPSGMTAPLPVLPPSAPYWFNTTEIPNVRRRIVVS